MLISMPSRPYFFGNVWPLTRFARGDARMSKCLHASLIYPLSTILSIAFNYFVFQLPLRLNRYFP
jgi:hypothetical protein